MVRVEIYRSPWFDLKGYLACKVKYSDGTSRTVLAHREVMEAALGRSLTPDELVHHKDENKKNNDLDNLSLTDFVQHGKHHKKPPTIVSLVCLECGMQFNRRQSAEAHFRKQLKLGPFCGKVCAGRNSANRQHGRVRQRGGTVDTSRLERDVERRGGSIPPAGTTKAST